MKPFDLEQAKAGKPVCTKRGEPVRIIFFNATGSYPIIGLIDDGVGNEVPFGWQSDGEYVTQGNPEDNLMMQSETIEINGHEVPKPMDTPPPNDHREYHVPDMSSLKLYNWIKWTGGMYDQRHLKRGMAHSTKEAAITHAKALLSFTEK